MALSLTAPCAPQAATGLHQSVTFDAYPPFSASAELIRRMLSPLAAARIRALLARNRATLRAQPIDLLRETFALYVPPAPAPPGGDALLVFVPPWDAARVPVQWIPVLNRTHTIFVTAARSGNDANVLDRRDPLALIAAYNVMQRYHVDPGRVYIGGFSGGSRVALRLALGYPDLFRGALLDAGSDPIGTAQIPLPSVDLLHRFQESSRIVSLVGDDDVIRQAQVARADASLKNWCVFDTDSVTMPHVGHELADAQGLDQALDKLVKPPVSDPARLVACRAVNTRDMHAQLRKAKSLLDQGKRDASRALLEGIDAHHGGLAAPRSSELLHAIDSNLAPRRRP